MGKHSIKNSSSTKRNAAIAAAVGVGTAVMNPAAANAVPVTVTNTAIVVDIPDQLMPHIQPYLGKAVQIKSSAKPAKAPKPAKPTPPKPAKSQGQRIADIALSKVGAAYVWGAAGPNAFDCSGLTSWAYAQAGKNIPRTSGAQASSGKPVAINALQPGDIVSYYGGASHVAIYVGNGKVVHALNSDTPVRVDDLNYLPINNAVRF